MDDTGKTRWARYQIAYHLVWIPKFRRKILSGEVRDACIDLIHACAKNHGFSILALEAAEDHVHCFVTAPPRLSPAVIVNHIKGYTSKMLRSQFPWLKKACGKDHLWTSAYYVGTAGTVSEATIRRYITDCQGK